MNVRDLQELLFSNLHSFCFCFLHLSSIYFVRLLIIIGLAVDYIMHLKGCHYSFMKNFPIIDFIQTLCMSRIWCCTMNKQIKIRPYWGFLFFISYQRCHILNIFYKFHKTCVWHKNIECITRISYIILFFFQLNTFYLTNKLLSFMLND